MGPMPGTARLIIEGNSHDLPVVVGTEGDRAIDITKLREATGHVTLDEGYVNTGSCRSAITFVDGEKGILRYRGIPIEQLAAKSTFVETCWLLIYGELPTREQLKAWSSLFTKLRDDPRGPLPPLRRLPVDRPPHGHPLGHDQRHELLRAGSDGDGEPGDLPGLGGPPHQQAAHHRGGGYKASIGQPIVYPKPHLDYCTNFLHMMFSIPFGDYEPDPETVAALQLILILHADHEQNCSSSTVRMVASSGANLFASCAAGVCALWGPLHGGANAAVVEMLQHLHDNNVDLKDYIARVKDKNSPLRLMGFGHRVYKNYDPRASIMKEVGRQAARRS